MCSPHPHPPRSRYCPVPISTSKNIRRMLRNQRQTQLPTVCLEKKKCFSSPNLCLSVTSLPQMSLICEDIRVSRWRRQIHERFHGGTYRIASWLIKLLLVVERGGERLVRCKVDAKLVHDWSHAWRRREFAILTRMRCSVHPRSPCSRFRAPALCPYRR